LVVLVHGYGSNGDDLIALAEMVRPALPDAAFVAPNAPSQLPYMAAAHQW
jgi:phospholipase/carboxylesterase